MADLRLLGAAAALAVAVPTATLTLGDSITPALGELLPPFASEPEPEALPPPGQAPVRSTTSGTFEGAPADARGIYAFKGIPFATPPVGPLRWRSPQPMQPPAGVQPATGYGASCLSAPGPNPDKLSADAAPESEDCLTLNIWTPDPRSNASKPVMVWIHGGGFQFGNASRPTWDGSILAGNDVVVVSIQYRLGVWGFLATDQFDAESGHSGMWGIEDQQAALRWIQANIRQFGGDPKKVTIFGESAGAHSVGILMASPQSTGLFHRTIVQSGASWDTEHGSLQTHEEALARGAAFRAKFLGQDLRAVPAELINAAAPWDYVATDPLINAFSPSVDGRVLTDAPHQAFMQGKQMKVPMLGGWNAVEWLTFAGHALPAAPAEVFYQGAAKVFGQACRPEFESLYPSSDPTNAQAQALQLAGDQVIAGQTWEMLWRNAARRPSYAYRFTYTSPYAPMAVHTAEVPFVFGTLTRQILAPTATPGDSDRALSALMMRYWTNFARTGDPNGPGLPNWPTIGADGDTTMEFDTTPDSAEANPDRARFAFLARYREPSGRLPLVWRQFGPAMPQYDGPGCGTP